VKATRWLLLLPLAWVLVYSGARWRHPAPLEYGEGVNLNWQYQVQAGEPLYPEVTETVWPWVHNPYPPLGPVLQAGADRILPFPHPYAAGRCLSLLAIAAAAGLLAAGMGPSVSRTRRLTLVLLFLASPITLKAASLMRVDALGLAAALASFFCLRERRTPVRWAASAALATAAVLIKPTFAAAGVVLLIRAGRDREPRRLVSLLAGAVLPTVLMAIWLFRREDPQLWLHLVRLQGLPRVPGEAFRLLAGFGGTHGLVLTGGLTALVCGGIPGQGWPASSWRCRIPAAETHLRDERLYLGVSLFILALTLGIQGSHSLYFLESWALLCLGLAHLPLPRVRPAVLLAGLQFLLFIPWETPPVFSRTYGQEAEPGRVQAFWPGKEDREMALALREELRTAAGPVLSTSPGWVLEAGAELHMQIFQFSALIESGQWDDRLLRTALEEQTFDRILLKGNAEQGGDPYLPADLQQLIADGYSLHRTIGPWHLYRR
jgi:hypothetical protein